MPLEKRLKCRSVSHIAKRITEDAFRSGYAYEFVLEDDGDVLAILDSQAEFGPTSGEAVWPIEVRPTEHATELADEIWSRLEYSDIAPFDGTTHDLWMHIIRCGAKDDPDSCSEVARCNPLLVDSDELQRSGWFCRFVVHCD